MKITANTQAKAKGELSFVTDGQLKKGDLSIVIDGKQNLQELSVDGKQKLGELAVVAEDVVDPNDPDYKRSLIEPEFTKQSHGTCVWKVIAMCMLFTLVVCVTSFHRDIIAAFGGVHGKAEAGTVEHRKVHIHVDLPTVGDFQPLHWPKHQLDNHWPEWPDHRMDGGHLPRGHVSEGHKPRGHIAKGHMAKDHMPRGHTSKDDKVVDHIPEVARELSHMPARLRKEFLRGRFPEQENQGHPMFPFDDQGRPIFPFDEQGRPRFPFGRRGRPHFPGRGEGHPDFPGHPPYPGVDPRFPVGDLGQGRPHLYGKGEGHQDLPHRGPLATGNDPKKVTSSP